MAWIRSSPSRVCLVNAEAFWIEKEKLCCGSLLADDKGFVLTDYETVKAALAELDKIHAWIESGAPGVYQVRGDADA